MAQPLQGVRLKNRMKLYQKITVLILASFTICPLSYSYDFRANSLCIGMGLMDYDYDEKLPAPFKSSETGTLPSVSISYTYKNPKEPYFNLRIERSWGETDYDGTTQEGVPLKTDTDNTFMTYEGSIGYTMLPTDYFFVVPYIGYGSNTWKRELGGPYPYDEDYSFRYLPVGIYMSYDVTENINLGINLALIYVLKAEMDIDSDYFSAETADLKERDGYRFELPMTIQFSNDWDLKIVPYYIDRPIGRSDDFQLSTGDMAYEPSSTCTVKGISLQYELLF